MPVRCPSSVVGRRSSAVTVEQPRTARGRPGDGLVADHMNGLSRGRRLATAR